jgi:hypothetical protein
MNTKLTVGLKPVAYHAWYWSRLDWREIKVPGPYREHWAVFYKGSHVAEVFQGKSGMWYGLVFGRFSVWRNIKTWVLYTVTAAVIGPKH